MPRPQWWGKWPFMAIYGHFGNVPWNLQNALNFIKKNTIVLDFSFEAHSKNAIEFRETITHPMSLVVTPLQNVRKLPFSVFKRF